jgi:hypothetical protein
LHQNSLPIGPHLEDNELYATPWNPWTLVETLDNKLGAISRKTLKWRHDVLPS